MSYRLFLDDLRNVPMIYPELTNDDFIVVRNVADFQKTILEKGLPDYISFDNDLGLDEQGTVAPDGYAAARWLVYESGLDLLPLRFLVHSANPVARVQIESLLTNYQKHLQEIQTP